MGNQTKAFDGTPEELFTTRRDLRTLGLTKPASVYLSERCQGLGYCASMEDFTQAVIKKFNAEEGPWND